MTAADAPFILITFVIFYYCGRAIGRAMGEEARRHHEENLAESDLYTYRSGRVTRIERALDSDDTDERQQ